MVFQRARSEEQKELRTRQILDAAADLFTVYPYHEITLAMIAAKLDFSRINMYKYIANKDDIFIKLLTVDIRLWVDDVIASYPKQTPLDIPSFSVLWAKILYRHTRYMKLISILNTVIEKNIPSEQIEQYQTEIFQTFYQLTETLCYHFPFLTDDLAKEILFIQKNFMCGLYPLDHIPQSQREGLEKLDDRIWKFTPSTTNFMIVLLTGYKQLYTQN